MILFAVGTTHVVGRVAFRGESDVLARAARCHARTPHVEFDAALWAHDGVPCMVSVRGMTQHDEMGSERVRWGTVR